MIRFLIGDNSYEITQALRSIESSFQGAAERIDGSALQLRDLPDLLMAATLFSDKRLVIIKDLSENKSVWSDFFTWLPRISDDIELVLVDTKPDKRTVTFKDLKKIATLQEFPAWSDRDTMKAESWTADEAKKLGVALDRRLVQLIVARVGMDQWQLASALEKLSLLEAVTVQAIEDTIDPRPFENVFNLFETALKGDAKKVHNMIRTLELTEEPYKLFALLSSQAFQLAAIQSADSSSNPAKDFGIHPFVVSKLSAYANRMNRRDIKQVIDAFAGADADIKLSRAEPWLLIERALLKVAA